MDAARSEHENGCGPTSSGMRIARDVSLSILGEEGVFFSEARQELHVFNTEATYIWCCLEEGLGADEIAGAYASVFEVSHARAERCVGEMLHRWQGLGYFSGVTVPAPAEIDFTTALGRLLGNPALRREFAASPHETALQQAVREQDREAFCSLDPIALEHQVALLQAKREKRKSRSRFAAEGERGLLELRASAVADTDTNRCLLLVGGATTEEAALPAALLAAGFSDVSDEVVVLEADSLRARFLHPHAAPETAAPCPLPSVDVSWIVFARHSPETQGGLRHLAGAAALQRLMRDSLIDAAHLDRHDVRSLVAWISKVECFELPFGSLAAAVRGITGLRR